MAETLGAVASGFAVVSLAIQVAETINKLRNFYSLMQSAPADILFAIEDLETLSLILEDVDRSVQQQVFLDPKAKLGVMRSWRLCKTATQGLVALVERLENNLGGAKGKGKMRAIGVAMKKGEIDDFRSKIEGAKTTMQLANQIYYQAVQNQRWESLEQDIMDLRRSHERHHSIIEREVVQIRSFVMTSPSANGHCPQKLLGSINAVELDEDVEEEDDIEVRKKPGSFRPCQPIRLRQQLKTYAGMNLVPGLLSFTLATDEHNKTASVSFALPKWICTRRFDLRMMKSRQGWDQSFRSYRMVSYDAKVFDYCMDGDIAGLKRLFASGQASPFEVDPDGRTPLHYAALYAHPQVCEFMIRHGADINMRTGWYGSLTQTKWNLSQARGDYSNLGGIPTGESFRGRTAYSTPLHLLCIVGHVLIKDGRKSLFREDHQLGCCTAIDQDFKKTLEVLVTSGADVALEDQDQRTAFHAYTGPASSFSWLVRESEWDIKSLSHEDYMSILACQSFNLRTNSGGEVCRQLATTQTLQTLAHATWKSLSLLHSLIFGWLWGGQDDSPSRLSFEDLIVDTICAGADLHSVAKGKLTPLLFLLNFTPKQPFDADNVQKWLALLKVAGVDLLEYGRIENEMHEKKETQWISEHENFCLVEIKELRIGETPEDFYIEFEDVYASTPLAADFWELAEAQYDEERFKATPGSWKDD